MEQERKIIKYSDLSTALKFLVVFAWIIIGFNILFFIIGFIIGIIGGLYGL